MEYDQYDKEYVENKFASAGPMTPKGIAILVVIAVLLLALALYFIPWPAYIELSATGAEVDPHGNVIAEGDFVLKAWYFNYLFQDDRISMEYLQMPNIEIESITEFDNGLPSLQPYPREPDRLWGVFMVEIPHPNGQEDWTMGKHCVLYTTADFRYFMINYTDGNNDNRFFIGADQDEPNYAEILDQCRLLKD